MRNGLRKYGDERVVNDFRSLFLTFGPKVRAMLLRQGADLATADDIVQETMLIVWSKSHLYARDKGALSTWIYAIARNLRIDRVRRQIVWENLCGEMEQLRDAAIDENEVETREQERMQVSQALAELPDEQSEVVRLSFIEGLSQNEIAERLNLPLGTVKSRMRLAFEKLRGSVESG